MEITPLHIVSSFEDKHTLVKGLLYLKLLEKGIHLPDNYLNTLSLFSIHQDNDEVVKEALDRNFYKSEQTIENSISKLVSMNLLIKTGSKKRKINEDIFPNVPTEYIVSTYKIHNLYAKL